MCSQSKSGCAGSDRHQLLQWKYSDVGVVHDEVALHVQKGSAVWMLCQGIGRGLE